MSVWKLIMSPGKTGPYHMQSDLETFNDLEAGDIPSTLRIYSWRPKCISYGYSQNIERELDVKKAQQLGWDIVKRPSGGGIVFHNEAEVTYSLVTEIDNPKLPKGLVPAYKKISEAIVFALEEIGVRAEIRNKKSEIRSKSEIRNPNLCFAVPAEYEVVVAGKKIVGSAQKRGKRALLQQGSIFVRDMSGEELALLKKPREEYNAVSVEEMLGRQIGFKELSRALIKGFEQILGIEFKEQ